MNAKIFFCFLLLNTFNLGLLAQVRGFGFQGYAVDQHEQPLATTSITAKFTIYDNSNPTVKYEEEQSFTTDGNGVFKTSVGGGSSFNNLSFSSRDFWMKVEVKKTHGSGTYNTISDARLNTVPYAKSAENGSPAGAIAQFAGTQVPPGWLICDGSAISRATYPDLFAAIGTSFGSGDGSTTFNLPNLLGRTLVGRHSSDADFDNLGKTGGAKNHSITVAQMPSHNHERGTLDTSSAGDHLHDIRPYSANGVGSSNCTSLCDDGVLYNKDGQFTSDFRTTTHGGLHNHEISGSTQNTGNGSSFGILQPYLTVNFIIRVF